MTQFSEGDRVRVDIPDESDPDHERYHGEHGTVVAVMDDELGDITSNEGDGMLLRVELESGESMDFRPVDLRSPFE